MFRPIVSIVHRERIPGAPANYTLDDVCAVREMVQEALNHLGGLSSIIYPGDKVLVKPNLVSPEAPEKGATTDPRVVAALIQLIRQETKPRKVLVADYPSLSSARDACRVTGMEDVAKKFGAEIAYLDEDALVEMEIPSAKALLKCKIPRTILDCDVYINVPKMKTHFMTTVTLGVKNQWGIVNFETRITCHKADLDQALVDLLRVARPDLTLIDGIIGMEGYGPNLGNLVEDMNVIIAGKDTVAVDAVTSAVMGILPSEVTTTRIAHAEGLGVGNLESIDVKGERIEKVRRQFRRPDGGWDIRGVFPNVTCYVGGACKGCMGWIRDGLEQSNARGFLPKLNTLSIITGRKTNVPDTISKPVVVVGDCAEQHKDRGYYIPGCPPWYFSRRFAEICEELTR